MKDVARRSMSSLRTYGLACFALLALLSACKTSEKTWAQELRSPDGKHIATGRSDIQGGFGTDGAQTTVDLNWTTGSQSAANILVLPDAPGSRGQPSLLEMKWLGPNTLQLTYKGHEKPLFQAVKCYGVDIILKTVPIDKDRGGQ